jgi:hypothetical protein
MFIKARLEDDVLKVYLPLREPKASVSGKNLVIATSRGPAGTDVEYKGQQVRVVANAYVRNSEYRVRKTKQARKKTSGPKPTETD